MNLSVDKKYTGRKATLADKNNLQQLYENAENRHVHLDWYYLEERLSKPGFYLIEDEGDILAGLAIQPENETIAWVRFFASIIPPSKAWDILWKKLTAEYWIEPEMAIASLALERWYAKFLESKNFQIYDNVVILGWNGDFPQGQIEPVPQVKIRELRREDLDSLVKIEENAFQPVWRLNQKSVSLLYSHAYYATVILWQDQIVGYMVSSFDGYNAHLVRIAVLKEMQKKGFGYRLGMDMINRYVREGYNNISVNTQSSNTDSLNLYHRLGFLLTGESFKMMSYKDEK